MKQLLAILYRVIDIPEWDFHWQYFYTLPKIMKIPSGARFHAIAVYDNTSDNPENPNDPPITVYEGAYTKDEMLMTFMALADYVPGDENIIIDSSFYFPTEVSSIDELFEFSLFPNPANKTVIIASYAFEEVDKCTITDVFGRNVLQINHTVSESSNQFLQTINIAHLTPGIYIVELLSGNTKAAKKLIVY
jgi:hypothetical protein